MSKVGFILSLIGGIWMAALWIFTFLLYHTYFDELQRIFSILRIIFALVAIIGGGVGSKMLSAGSIMCFIVGLSIPIFGFSILGYNYLDLVLQSPGVYIPEILLLIGGIVCLIEWRKGA